MLVAIFIFFVLVGLFAFSIIYSNVQKQANAAAEARTYSLITSIADSPELNCVGSRTNCIDSDKLLALGSNKNYQNYWPFSSLMVIKITNKTEEKMINCNTANYPNCDKFVVYDKKVKNENKISSFAALCRSEYEEGVYEKCEIAKIIAGIEIK